MRALSAHRVPLAAILAGGKARRMGRQKATIDVGGIALIERVYQAVAAAADRVVVVGGGPLLAHRGVPTIADRYPGTNAMGGLATALHHAEETIGPDALVLCVACDMPLLRPALFEALADRAEGADVVVPKTRFGFEPLCALYRATCLPAFREEIARGNLRIFAVYPAVRWRELGEEDIRKVDPDLESFANVNRPEDLEAIRRAVGRPVLVRREGP